jgi:hypothetical protein
VIKQSVNRGRPEFSKRPNGLADEALRDREFMVTGAVGAHFEGIVLVLGARSSG